MEINRQKLERAGTIHWFHWCIVGLSLCLTLFAWYYSNEQLNARVQAQFDREADQAVELVLERMQKYEDALWAGVAYVETVDGDVAFEQWRDYAQSIQIEHKYPGTNGMGVVHAIPEADLENYLKRQQQGRPNYGVHPPHEQGEYLPISYIIPVKGNEQAVGLDMAHENNRYTAALKCRDSGDAQVTGPITLVQDAAKTPGFLFYAPIYHSGDGDVNSVQDRRDRFHGMVYAPVVVRKLMAGTLRKESRHVGIAILDGDQVLYDEHVESEEDFDPNPLFKKTVDVPLYGRVWHFDIWSAKSFRAAASSKQPLTILLGGLTIDVMLIALFYLISRASRRALNYADAMN